MPSSEILQIVTDLLTWLFFMDDQCDEASIGKQTEALGKLYTRCCTVLEGAELTDQDEPLFHALYDLRTRLVQQASIVHHMDVPVQSQYGGVLRRQLLGGYQPYPGYYSGVSQLS